MRRQRPEQLELDVGQLHRVAPHLDHAAWDVDHETVVLDPLGLPVGGRWGARARRSSARTRERNSRIENGFVM